MRGAAVLFLTLFLLRELVGGANTALSGMHVWLFAGGLFVTYAALAAPFGEGFAACLLAGLLCDALSPVAFGTHAVLFALSHALVFNARERLQRDETAVRVVVALVVNLGLYCAITILRMRATPGALPWPRLLADLTWSEAAVAVAAPWFFALQERTLELARAIPSRSA